MRRLLVACLVLALLLGACSRPKIYYPDCTAAQKAGAAPLHKGEPGYRVELDRNRDGIACE